MSQLLDRAAVGVVSGEEAGEILQAYIATVPSMVFNHTLAVMTAQRPKGTGAGDQFVDPR